MGAPDTTAVETFIALPVPLAAEVWRNLQGRLSDDRPRLTGEVFAAARTRPDTVSAAC